jgi:hypothetical protein
MERIPVIDLLAYICILIPAKRYGIVLIVGNQSDLLINDSFFHICIPANARNFLSDWIPYVRNTPSRNSA